MVFLSLLSCCENLNFSQALNSATVRACSKIPAEWRPWYAFWVMVMDLQNEKSYYSWELWSSLLAIILNSICLWDISMDFWYIFLNLQPWFSQFLTYFWKKSEIFLESKGLTSYSLVPWTTNAEFPHEIQTINGFWMVFTLKNGKCKDFRGTGRQFSGFQTFQKHFRNFSEIFQNFLKYFWKNLKYFWKKVWKISEIIRFHQLLTCSLD